MRWPLYKILPVAHAAAVVGASVVTFRALDNNITVDGLEFMLILPLGLPWSVLPVRGFGSSYYVDAVLLSLMGFVNSVLLYVILRRKARADAADIRDQGS